MPLRGWSGAKVLRWRDCEGDIMLVENFRRCPAPRPDYPTPISRKYSRLRLPIGRRVSKSAG